MTYYDILEISEKASSEVIRMAYKALCKKYHPDVYEGDKSVAEEKMKKINEAYDTLSNEAKKREYDYFLNSQKSYQQRTYSEPRRESYYQPKRENTAPNIDVLLKNGFSELENGNWLIAEVLFQQVLAINPINAEAYLGKLMIELRVKKRGDLKNHPQPFTNYRNYQLAYTYGDNSLKLFLNETTQFIIKRNHETKCRSIYDRACLLPPIWKPFSTAIPIPSTVAPAACTIWIRP